MPNTANEQTVDVLGIENIKTIAGSSASAQAKVEQAAAAALGSMLNDMAAGSARRNNIADQAMGLLMKNMIEVDPNEAFSLAKQFTSNDVATQMAQLLAVLNSGQQGNKSAGNTPPVTP